MTPVLVDTDILINFLRGRDAAKNFILSKIEDGPLLCSVITVAEIVTGMRSHEEARTMALLDSLELVDVSRQIAEKAGRYKSGFTNQNLELDDSLIAATAYVSNAELATGNIKHYPMDDIRKIAVTG
jgi:predicted nucleic acid-binding protein